MKKLLLSIGDWIKTVPAATANDALSEVIAYCKIQLSNLNEIIAGTATLPGIGNNVPDWAIQIAALLKSQEGIDPELLENVLLEVMDSLTTYQDGLQNALNKAPVLTPEGEQTASHKALLQLGVDIAITANAAKKTAPSVNINLTSIEMDAAKIPELIESLIKEVTGK